jgi:hypothetical protein
MPVETIKCQECGSSDVLALKTGGFVCSHCDAIFDRVIPFGLSGAVGCQIDRCGVTSVGRCLSCGRAFCRTHQGWRGRSGGQIVPLLDSCVSCEAARASAEEEENERSQREYEREQRLLTIIVTSQDSEDVIDALIKLPRHRLKEAPYKGALRAWTAIVAEGGMSATSELVTIRRTSQRTGFRVEEQWREEARRLAWAAGSVFVTARGQQYGPRRQQWQGGGLCVFAVTRGSGVEIATQTGASTASDRSGVVPGLPVSPHVGGSVEVIRDLVAKMREAAATGTP